ncbi:tyrosine-type recombinase/integrase [Nocardia terpenica]|uniref:Tyrosine-type recombinase/integrase n=1 Tax=Nocardia terpenica TaxID=455432 RepID=A0A6G9ZH12_9NOCA|nr:tyrosine-type recombinase/integrase [Nocardia terpenica]
MREQGVGRRQDLPANHRHDLRHTAASLGVACGANVKAIQRMLGHASAAMTLDIYADLFNDDLEAVARKMGRSWAKCGHNRNPGRSSRPRNPLHLHL